MKNITSLPLLLIRKYRAYQNTKRLQEITDQVKKDKRGQIKILISPSFCINHTLKIHDILISSILAEKGANIAYSSQEFGLPSCQTCGGVIQLLQKEKNLCKYCQRFERNDKNLSEHLERFSTIFKMENLLNNQDLMAIKNQVDKIPADKLETFILDNLPFGKYAVDIVRNANYVADIKLVKNYQNLLRTCTQSNLIYYKYFLKAIIFFKPDIILSHDAFYAPWAILYEIAKRDNITFYNYYPGLRHNTFHYVKNKIAMDLDIKELYEKWKNKKIKQSELSRLDKIFKNRKKGKIYAGKETWVKNEPEFEKFQKIIGSKKPTAVLYGNVLWDLSALNKEAIFSSIQESFFKTIDFFIKNPQYNLVIKPHPGELRFGHESKEKLTDLIKNKYAKLADNILIVNPKSFITSYDLIKKTQLSIVYTTTVGIESVILGTPTITLGKTHYHAKGFTYDPQNQEEFFQTIKNILDSQNSEELKKQQELARKYYYLYFFIYFYDYNIIKFNLDDKTIVVPKSLEDLKNNSKFSRLAEAIIQQKDIPYFDQGIQKND